MASRPVFGSQMMEMPVSFHLWLVIFGGHEFSDAQTLEFSHVHGHKAQ